MKMTYRSILLGLAAAGLLLLGACLPEGMPGYSPDDKTIAVVTKLKDTGDGTLWLYDVQAKTSRAHRMPDGWRLDSAKWLGDKLWVVCQRDAGQKKDPKTGKPVIDKKTGKPVRVTRTVFAEFDPRKNALSAKRRLAMTFWSVPFLAAYEGKPALFSANLRQDAAAGKTAYDVLSFPQLKKLATVEQPRILPAGHGWTLRAVSKGAENGMTSDLVATEVVDGKGRKIAAISAAEIGRACFRGVRSPAYARLSADKTVILMVFDTKTIFRRHAHKYTFGVFGVRDAKLLWAGSSDSCFGTPVVKPREVWTLEMVGRDVDTGDRTAAALLEKRAEDPPARRFALVRLTPGGKADRSGAKRQIVFGYDLGRGFSAGEFAPSPDRSKFLLTVNGATPKLLFIPIGQGTTPADMSAVPLVRPKG